MTLLVSGLVIFFIIHLMPTVPPLQRAFKKRVGEKGYQGIFALASLIGFVLIVMGYAEKPLLSIPEWTAPALAVKLATPLLWLAIVLQPAAHMKTNIKRFTRHPMLWGIAIWSSLHLWLNGDKASLLLFGSFLAYSLWAMLSANMRGAKKQTTRVPVKNDVIVVVAGTVTYVVLVFAHGWITGVALV